MKGINKIEKHLSAYHKYLGKVESELVKIIDEIVIHSHIFPNEFVTNYFPGDGLGVYPKYLQDGGETYIPIYVPITIIIKALKNGTVLDEEWFKQNRSL
jgi:hypothetical protein